MLELWPFTNFHDLNLDWMIKTIKVYTKKVDDFIADITEAWNDFKEWVTGEIDQMHDDFAEYVNVTEGALNTGAIADGAITTPKISDGAVTKPKIDPDFLLEIENAYVTPEMYGAVGDGVTDDSAALRAAAATGKTIIATAEYKLDDSEIIFSDNTNLVGGKFIVPSTVNGTPVFRPGNNSIFAYFEIESVNDQTAIIAGSTPVSGSTSSNRYTFYISEKENVKIKDVDTNNLYSLAFITSTNTVNYNNNISVENCRCENGCLPIFAAMCENLVVKNTLLHTGTNADNGLFHSAYITYGVNGCDFENIEMQNDGLASSIHFQVSAADYALYNMKCENIYVNGCRIVSNASIGIGRCENCTIENLDAKITITSGSGNRSLQIQNDSDNINFKNCNFNFDSETSVYMGETSSNIVFNKCTFIVKATRIFNNMAELLCTFCSFDITNKSSSYPTLVGPGTSAYDIKLVKCVVTGNVRFYITTGADAAGSILKCDGLEVYKTADANSPGTAIDVTNAAVEVLNSIFIGYTNLSNAGTLKNVLSNSATYN